jgi:hypothetical protein
MSSPAPGRTDQSWTDHSHRESGSPEDGSLELDKILGAGRKIEQLPKGKIYLEAPIEMKVGDKRAVDARVGINVPDDILRGHVRAGDQSIPGMLLVSHEMIATLSGPGFAITRTTSEKQTVANGFPTVWQWDVEAKQNEIADRDPKGGVATIGPAKAIACRGWGGGLGE